MKTFGKLIALAVATLLLAAADSPAQFTVLHNFTGSPGDGSQPAYSSLTLSNSTLYGMTLAGGSNDLGVIFQIGTNGTSFTILRSFTGTASDGANPFGSLILDDSTLYGMTLAGGASNSGTVFQVDIDGESYTNLHSFTGGASDGATPFGSLTLSNSFLYGMTGSGGTSDSGTVFQVDTDGTGYTNLHSFVGSSDDGSAPLGALVLSDSFLYGMTFQGGNTGGGVIFKVGADGTGYTNLHSFVGFPTDGSAPLGSLILSNSVLYGMTFLGGSSPLGTIFKINTNGSGYTNLHSFAGGASDGSTPLGSLILDGSTLYGMTSFGGAANSGTVFQVNTDGSGFELLYSFGETAGDGRAPNGSLIKSGSTLYGMANSGGTSNLGVIFSLTLPIIESVTISNTFAIVGTNTIVAAGDVIGFAATAHPASSLSYSWDFGNGSHTAPSALNTTTHTYSPLSNCGPYTVTVTVSNFQGVLSGNLPIIVACQLTITKLQMKVNFDPAKVNADSSKLTASVDLGAGFNPSNKVVAVDIGGAQVSFTLDAKGRGTTAKHTCKLKFSAKTGLWTVTVSLKNGSWATPWAAHGLTDVTTPKTGVAVSLPVVVVIGDETFAEVKSLLYKAAAGKSGSAK